MLTYLPEKINSYLILSFGEIKKFEKILALFLILTFWTCDFVEAGPIESLRLVVG